MQDGKFWRTVAIVICGGLLYVGHGLHNGASDRLPSLVNTAHGGGVAVDNRRSFTRIYTSDESGTYLYVWDEPAGGGNPKHVATVAVPVKKSTPARTFDFGQPRNGQQDAQEKK
jgi:hypothetical protein